MDRATHSYGPGAYSDATRLPDPAKKAGYPAFGSGSWRDAKAQSQANLAIAVLVRTEQGGRLGCIRTLSSRSLTLSMAKPPRCVEPVEIVAQGQLLAGHVEWVSECHAGIALSQTIDVEAVLRGGPGCTAASSLAMLKTSAMPAASAIYRRSGIAARQWPFAAIVAIGACAALLIAFGAHDLLTDVLGQVGMGEAGRMGLQG